MTSREIEERISSYKDACEEAGGEIPLPAADVDALFGDEENPPEESVPEKYRDAFIMARDGDFSQFDTLPLFLRNALGALEIRDFNNRFSMNPSYDKPELQEHLRSKAMNAAFRAGMFALKKSESEVERRLGENCDRIMSYNIMQKTMLPPTEEEVESFTQAVGADNAPAELERNLARQRVMAKMLFMSQLGKYEVITKGKSTSELNETVAETLAHGGRTNYVLPLGSDTQTVFDAVLGENRGQAAGVYKRTAATHYASRRKINGKGMIGSQSKEEKLRVDLRKILRNQNGMDLAVGGIGAKGPGTAPIMGRGESGHAYMRIENGDKKHCGSLLLGIEGCAPQASSGLGSTHGIRAIPGKQSAFISGKGAVGNKLGGRQVDLSALSSQELSEIIGAFDEKYTELQANANTPEGRQRLSEINDMLIGKPMETQKLIGMLNDLGMNDPKISQTVTKAREGYYASKIDTLKLSKEEYQQNIRKTYKTKDACKIATARFEKAGNNLELSVGAIKELMFTHATRPSNYFWRHPIKNYQENKTIKELIKGLENSKNFSRSDIAREFMRNNDTFALNWGEGLSNDSREIAIMSEKTFYNKDSKLADVIKEATSKYFKDEALKNNEAQVELEVKESQPSNDLNFELMGASKAPAGPMREKFSCFEAIEASREKKAVSQKVEPTRQQEKQRHP